MEELKKRIIGLLNRANEINWNFNMCNPNTQYMIRNWLNDASIIVERYLKKHPLYNKMHTLIFQGKSGCVTNLASCLQSVLNDDVFMKNIQIEEDKSKVIEAYSPNNDCYKYDVFISHANSDKLEIVEELYKSLSILGVNIFYDKETFEWGNLWKNKILEGTAKSLFAIIVISNNFFGREWTENELNEFLKRQNSSGDEIILPILHGIKIDDLKKKYPRIADIQAINTVDYSTDKIALLFARKLIKRMKEG